MKLGRIWRVREEDLETFIRAQLTGPETDEDEEELPLQGYPRWWRLRVGDWRVLYSLSDELRAIEAGGRTYDKALKVWEAAKFPVSAGKFPGLTGSGHNRLPATIRPSKPWSRSEGTGHAR